MALIIPDDGRLQRFLPATIRSYDSPLFLGDGAYNVSIPFRRKRMLSK